MSIKQNLQSSILFLAVIPVILMALLAYFVSLSKYASINEVNITKTASDYSFGFTSQLESQIIETEALADTNNIKSYLLEKVNSPDALLDTNSAAYQSILESIVQLSNNADHSVNYSFYDIDGYLTITTDDDAVSDWAEIMDKTVSEYTTTIVIPKSDFDPNTLDIITPVIVNGNIIGLLRTNIKKEYFGIFISAERGTFLLDKAGKPIFGHKTTKEDKTFLNHIKSLFNSSTNNDTMVKLNDAFSENTDYLYGYATIPTYDWIYVVKQDTSTYTNIVSSLPGIMIILLIAVVIVAAFITRNIVNLYTIPIFQLQEDIRAAASGKLDVHCDVNSDDEFGDLADNFNQMMDIISTNYTELVGAHQKLEDNQIELQHNYEHIENLAYTDALTGIYNRLAFYKFADKLLKSKNEKKKRHAMIFIDLDGFKAINDTLGHDYGDLLLQAVTAELSKRISKYDILGRNGGDEFVILRAHPGSDQELQEFMTSLVDIASHPFILNDETVKVTISAGCAVYPSQGTTISELMKKADIAMYTSKMSGKNSYTFFSLEMKQEIERKNELIEILKDAIKMQDIYLVYQPLYNNINGDIIGCEALMRLDSIELGNVSPTEFIPVACEAGMIDEIGEWALFEACRFNSRLLKFGIKPIFISVNITPLQLMGDKLLNTIKSIPKLTGMPLEHLVIELTENVIDKNYEHNLEIINQVKELGVRIALDDYGTKSSSFNVLSRLPIDILKLNSTFIAKICDNEKEAYISETIIKLAHELGLTVVAGGVENDNQRLLLKEQSCDIVQGFMLSKPLDEEDFMELISE